MKYFYILLVLIVAFCLIGQKTELCELSREYDSGEYCFCLKGNAEESEETRTVKNGSETLVYCPLYLSESVKASVKDKIRGESFRFYGDIKDAENIVNKLGARVVSEGYVGDIYCVYLYSGKLAAEPLSLFGEKVNMQIAIEGGRVTVGCPLILCGY